MNDTTLNLAMQDIAVAEVFPHTPKVIRKILTTGDLMARRLMAPRGFADVRNDGRPDAGR